MNLNKIKHEFQSEVWFSEISKDQWINEIQSVCKKISNGFIAIWLVHQVAIGEVKNGEVVLPKGFELNNSDYIIRIRIFNENHEAHIWKQENSFNCRYRQDLPDNDKEQCMYTDNDLVLWGTQTKVYDSDFLESYEKRGTAIIIPKSVGRYDSNGKNERLVLKTRNYIEFDELGQAGYVDSRFVNLEIKKIES